MMAPARGCNDPTPVTPVGGNPGTTLGAQRLNAFQRAADIWTGLISSTVTIRVGAKFDPLTCTETSAVLGSAGANTVHRDFSRALVASTWYPAALGNALGGSDLDPGNNDISATFNSSIGTTCTFPNVWYYGLDGSPPGSQIDFVSVVVHELGHGLGFQTFVDLASGAKLLGFNDTFMRNLEDHGATPSDYPGMTAAQRVAASKDRGNLHWVSANVKAASGVLTAGKVGDHVRMYAPSPQEPGSSVSHWDTVLTPNEIMEPGYASPKWTPGLALPLFQDIGWTLLPTAVTFESFTALGSDEGRVLLQWQTGFEVDNLDFNIYREQGGQRIRVNPHIIAGSALLVGPGITLRAGHSYTWVDESAPSTENARYWLEDIDLSGQSTWHGPVAIERPVHPGLLPPSGQAQAALLSSLGRGAAHRPLSGPGSTERRAPLAPLTAAPSTWQSPLATQPAVKLGVRQEGWCRVSLADLVAAGLNPGVNTRLLHLYVDGHEIPMLVTGGGSERLNPYSNAAIEFYGLGLDAAWTDTRVYWLAAGSSVGQRIAQVSAQSAPPVARSFPYTVERKDRTIYFSALLNGERENFFGAVLNPTPVAESLLVHSQVHFVACDFCHKPQI